MSDDEKPPTVEELRDALMGVSRNLKTVFDAQNALANQMKTFAVHVEAVSNIILRVKARKGGASGRVCGLCLATDDFGGSLFFENEQFGKLCADCEAEFKKADERAKKFGEQAREPGA